MSATRTSIENAVRAWLVAGGAEGGVPLADTSVIFADQDVVRPATSYVTVKVIVYDTPVHTDESLSTIAVAEDLTESAVWKARGQRTGTASVNAYGTAAEGWLERAVLMLQSPSIQVQLVAAGLTIRPNGGMNNLSGLLDDKTETRLQRDFFVDYQRTSSTTETEAQVELELVEHDDNYRDDPLDSGTPPDRTETVTIEVS